MPLTSFSRLISQLAKADPDCLAVTCGDHTITRQRLDSNSNRLARAYQKRGVKAGDFVTVALPNSIEFFEACIALWKLGATPQPELRGNQHWGPAAMEGKRAMTQIMKLAGL